MDTALVTRAFANGSCKCAFGLAEQRQRLIETIERYRADLPQRDDITVLAFKLP
jgi:serine phosphatase RsbU (regulator of sigma subunit)